MTAKIVLWLTGLGFIAFGLWALSAPLNLAQLLHFELTDKQAITEMRAFYGGLEIGLGVFMILGVIKPEFTRVCLTAGALILGMTATARCFGLLIDSSTSRLMLMALGLEVLGALACVWALRTSR